MLYKKLVVECKNIEVFQKREFHFRNWNNGEIFLFTVNLSDFIKNIPSIKQILTTQELYKAKSFYFKNGNENFILSRGITKIIISGLLNTHPSKVQLMYSDKGKPYIENHTFNFNLSHSNNQFILGIARNEIGVDLELKKSITNLDLLISSFNSLEKKSIQYSNDPTAEFYKIWTRKEALVKAIGMGITDEFHEIICSEGTHSLDIHSNYQNWSSNSFSLDTNIQCAIAYPNNILPINLVDNDWITMWINQILNSEMQLPR